MIQENQLIMKVQKRLECFKMKKTTISTRFQKKLQPIRSEKWVVSPNHKQKKRHRCQTIICQLPWTLHPTQPLLFQRKHLPGLSSTTDKMIQIIRNQCPDSSKNNSLSVNALMTSIQAAIPIWKIATRMTCQWLRTKLMIMCNWGKLLQQMAVLSRSKRTSQKRSRKLEIHWSSKTSICWIKMHLL